MQLLDTIPQWIFLAIFAQSRDPLGMFRSKKKSSTILKTASKNPTTKLQNILTLWATRGLPIRHGIKVLIFVRRFFYVCQSDRYSCAWKFGRPCAAATLLPISPDVYNVASCHYYWGNRGCQLTFLTRILNVSQFAGVS